MPTVPHFVEALGPEEGDDKLGLSRQGLHEWLALPSFIAFALRHSHQEQIGHVRQAIQLPSSLVCILARTKQQYDDMMISTKVIQAF